jgi:hypothetical protein
VGKSAVLVTHEELENGVQYALVEMRLTSESGNKGLKTLYGTGKFLIQYERVMYSSGMLCIEPTLHRLATGKLGLEIKAPEREKTPKKQEQKQ